MFEPKTYGEKQAALTDMFLQQTFSYLLQKADQKEADYLRNTFYNYGKAKQALRNAEAARGLGPVVREDGTLYSAAADIIALMQLNFGRAYLRTEAHTPAPAGTIGSEGYAKKFKDFIGDLPELDAKLGPTMATGFYADKMTAPTPIPALALTFGSETILISIHGGVSVLSFSWDHVSPDYDWSRDNHYSLRAEAYDYRDNRTAAEIVSAMAEALATQGVNVIYLPTSAKEAIEGMSIALPDGFAIDYVETRELDKDGKPVQFDERLLAEAVELMKRHAAGEKLSDEELQMIEGAKAKVGM